MSDKSGDKFIDELFKDSIDNIETEPSDHFWNKAYDSILKNENSAYTKKIWRLRGVTVVLGLAVAGLIGYNAYTTIKLSNIVDRMAGLEKQQTGKNDVRTNDQQPNNNSVNANAVVAENSQPAVGKSARHGITGSTLHNSTLASVTTRQWSSSQRQFNLTANNNNANASSAQTLADNSNSEENRKASAQSVEQGINNIMYLEEKPITIPPQDKSDSNLLAVDIDDQQSTVKPIVEENEAQLPADKPKFAHRLAVSAYFAPSVADPVLKSNSQNANFNPNDVKSREHEQFAYTAGANLSCDITNRLTVQLGCEFRNYKFSLDPTKVEANSGELNSGYPYITSSGTVYMPYITGYTPFGYYDTVATAKGTATRSYLSIPLHIKYYFIEKPKFGLYLTAGGSMNILTSNYATVHCQNSWGEEDLYLYDVLGAKTVNFSGIVGFGATFELGRGVSMFLEPSYSGAITPNTSNSPVTVYSNYFDFAAGISYRF